MNDPTVLPVVQLRARGQVTIPLDVRRRLKLEPGDVLSVYVTEKREVVLVPQVVVDRVTVEQMTAGAWDRRSP